MRHLISVALLLTACTHLHPATPLAVSLTGRTAAITAAADAGALGAPGCVALTAIGDALPVAGRAIASADCLPGLSGTWDACAERYELPALDEHPVAVAAEVVAALEDLDLAAELAPTCRERRRVEAVGRWLGGLALDGTTYSLAPVCAEPCVRPTRPVVGELQPVPLPGGLTEAPR